MATFHSAEVPQIVQTFLDDSGFVTASGFARRAGVSRQTAHAHLTRLVERGWLVRDGRGRATHYRSRNRGLAVSEPSREVPSSPPPTETLWVQVHARVPCPLTREDALRALAGAERVRRVLCDFSEVGEVGPEFARALFHEWLPAHPGVRLEVVNTRPEVRRALSNAQHSSGRAP